MNPENVGNKPLIRWVNRQQMSWRAVDVERLIDEEHLARAIWELVGRLDLSSFYAGIESSAVEGGRPAFDPQLLISLWVYAYSQGIGSAREVARRWRSRGTEEPGDRRGAGGQTGRFPLHCASFVSRR